MEVSRKRLRDEVLKRLEYMKTCVLARELCLLVRTNRAVLDPEDVRSICVHISDLCKEAGCKEASGLCSEAAEQVSIDEAKYLELCSQSCMKCGESRRPAPKKSTYVT